MVCSKNHNNRPIEEFILVSPAPVDTAAKLSNILILLSNKEKERAKDLIASGKFCESMATELLALGELLCSDETIETFQSFTFLLIL